MSDTSALEKIKRLLRLGRSPNQHEAASAMAMAAKLALKYQIDLADVKADEEREAIAHEWFESRANYNLVERSAAEVITTLFPVSGVISDHHFAFVGSPTAIASAKWALSYLIECAARELKEWRKRRRLTSAGRPSRSAEHNFLQGWKLGIYRLAAAEKAKTPELCDSRSAIILADHAKERESYIDREMEGVKEGRTRKGPKKRDMEAYLSGVRAGMNTRLSQPIESKGTQLQLV